MRIAYLLKRFPRLSETFILHEILALERQGVDLALYSLLRPGEAVVHRDVARVRAVPHYVPDRRNFFAFVRNHARLARHHPGRYAHTLAYIARRRRSPAALKHFARAGWLGAELEREGVTHLHAHFAHGPASVAHFVHLLTGLRFSFTAHAKDIFTSPRDLLAVKLRAAEFVVTCTDFNVGYLRDLEPGLEQRDITRIYHGVDLSKFQGIAAERLGPLADVPLILSIGRLVEKKGLRYLIDAFSILRDQGYRARLEIVGDGERRGELERQILDLGLEAHVELGEARSQDELIDLYGRAAVFALPCIVTENGDRDGIPNVLVEAMRMGVPVVSTDISGIPELVQNEETGLLVPPRDPAALAVAIARLLDDADLRIRLKEGAAHRVTAEFDLERNAACLRSRLVGART